VSDLSHYNWEEQHISFLATCGAFVRGQQNTSGALVDNVNKDGIRTESPRLLAESYFHRQLPALLASARVFRVHPYFLGWNHGVLPGEASHHSMITTRLRHWGKLQRLDGRDDFRIEKSKCDMLRFFERNGLPTPPVLGFYWTPREAGHALSEHSVGQNQNHSGSWPLFVKACHLTQGSLKSVRKVHSAAEVRNDTPQLLCWLRRMFSMRADDSDRMWTRESNELTDVIAPGFAIQSTVGAWAHSTGRKVLELKVEVFYGRAYLAIENSFWTMFLRDDVNNDAVSPGTNEDGQHSGPGSTPLQPPLCLSASGSLFESHRALHGLWRRAKPRLECAWDLAERTARAMGADIVRIDIFLTPDEPGCTLNEISLSSAMKYGPHSEMMARLWTLEEARTLMVANAMTEPQASTPVYLL
jgi:hypothetical protein